MNVVVLLLDSGLASTAIAPMEVFRAAGVLWNAMSGLSPKPVFRVRTASIEGALVRPDGRALLTADGSIASVRRADLILVPATGLETDKLLGRHGKLVPWLRRWRDKGAAIAGVCSGVSLLAEAGLLDGKPATTHWGLVDEYRERYPDVDWQPELFITESDGIYCAGGVYASLDLSLYLVEKYAGHEIAMQTAKSLLIDAPRRWQSGYATPPRRREHGDEKVQDAQQWLQEHFHEEFHFDELAARIGMSPRNFARRFKKATGETPLAYLHQLRIGESKHLLETEYTTIQEITRRVGYEDVLFFRKLFSRHTGMSPQAYRQKFGVREAHA